MGGEVLLVETWVMNYEKIEIRAIYQIVEKVVVGVGRVVRWNRMPSPISRLKDTLC